MTLGGNDVIVGPKGGEWGDRFCTGTGDDQVFYVGYRDEVSMTPSTVESISGRETTERRSPAPEISFIHAGPGDDTVLFGRKSSAHVDPGPGDDLIRGPDLRGSHDRCIDLRGRQVRSGSTLRGDARRARGTTGFLGTPDAPSAAGSTMCCSAPPETTNSTPETETTN